MQLQQPEAPQPRSVSISQCNRRSSSNKRSSRKDSEDAEAALGNIEFEKTVSELYAEGLCTLPSTKWIN
jgi:hypothetical protein